MLAALEIASMRTPLASSRWLTCPRPDASAPLRLWCVPFAGGGAAVWHPWAHALAGLAEVIAIRAPGRESRLAEPPLVRIDRCVAELVREIAPYARENYALCGHSLGALIAFELVRALRRAGLGLPRALIVCGARAPHHPPDVPLVHPLPRHDFVREIERRYGAIAAEIRNHPDFLELLLPVLRADLEMYETYQHRPATPLAQPILALGGADDAIVSAAQIRDWSDYTAGEFESAILAGGHFFPQDDVPGVMACVRPFLGRLLARSAQAPDRTWSARAEQGAAAAPLVGR